MNSTLEIIDHKVCVAYRSPMYNEPKLVTNYWPTTESARDIETVWPSWIGKEVSGDGRQGDFSIRIGGDSMSGWHILRLVSGAQTRAIKTVVEDIPCPKVRNGIETRWNDGRWQKYLKSKGWVNA